MFWVEDEGNIDRLSHLIKTDLTFVDVRQNLKKESKIVLFVVKTRPTDRP